MTAPRRARPDAGRTTVLYDADCGFCRWSVATLLRADRHGRLWPVAIQSDEGAALLTDVPAAARLGSAHTASADGRRHSGGAWLAPALAEVPGGRAPAAALRALRAPVELVYALIARNRATVSRLVPAAAKRGAQARIDRHRALLAGARSEELVHAAR